MPGGLPGTTASPLPTLDLGASPTAQPGVDYLEPFAVDFFGASSRRVCMMENGYLHVLAHENGGLHFGAASSHCRQCRQRSRRSALVAGPGYPPATSTSGTYFDVVGSEPGQRRLVFEWREYAHTRRRNRNQASTITFE